MSATAKRLSASVGWVLISFLLLTWCLYAVNESEEAMLTAITGERGAAKPSLNNVPALMSQRSEAKTVQEADSIDEKILEEFNRYSNTTRAEASLRELTERLWRFWGFSAMAPVVAIWWPSLQAARKRNQLVTK